MRLAFFPALQDLETGTSDQQAQSRLADLRPEPIRGRLVIGTVAEAEEPIKPNHCPIGRDETETGRMTEVVYGGRTVGQPICPCWCGGDCCAGTTRLPKPAYCLVICDEYCTLLYSFLPVARLVTVTGCRLAPSSTQLSNRIVASPSPVLPVSLPCVGIVSPCGPCHPVVPVAKMSPLTTSTE